MRRDVYGTLGERVAHIRASFSQRAFAEELGVPLRTYQTYEKNQREPDMRLLAGLFQRGWNLNWVLFGEGPDRLDAHQESPNELSGKDSQALRPDDLTMAVTLAQEALDGRTLPPDKYGTLVTLIYDALVNGLPSAQVLAFAQPAARGLREGESDGESSSVGGSGQRTARRG